MEELILSLIPENDPRLKEPCEPWDFKLDGDPTELIKAMTKVIEIGCKTAIAISKKI